MNHICLYEKVRNVLYDLWEEDKGMVYEILKIFAPFHRQDIPTSQRRKTSDVKLSVPTF